jgi:hypothetical protein
VDVRAFIRAIPQNPRRASSSGKAPILRKN